MKANQNQFAPRKVPQQERALFTVDSILTAARTIIEQKGYEAASTNHVADVAGVSIGSLYQYFPSKEAIVAALVEDAVLKAGERTRKFLIERMDAPLAAGIREIVGHLLEVRREYGLIFRRLAREVPRFRSISGQLTTEKYLYNTIHAFYRQHRDEILVEDLETAMFVLEHLVVGAIDAYLDNDAPILNDAELVQQVSDAVIKYLTK
ncbi:MAG: TetR/AcrR family transcriptional regulator [Caulobacteraceae bacterium]|nr:TetR/AcrR family transcriptional regulator [Caulobacteraceae bacterium]